MELVLWRQDLETIIQRFRLKKVFNVCIEPRVMIPYYLPDSSHSELDNYKFQTYDADLQLSYSAKHDKAITKLKGRVNMDHKDSINIAKINTIKTNSHKKSNLLTIH